MDSARLLCVVTLEIIGKNKEDISHEGTQIHTLINRRTASITVTLVINFQPAQDHVDLDSLYVSVARH